MSRRLRFVYEMIKAVKATNQKTQTISAVEKVSL